MDYIWIILLALSAILLAINGKRVNKAEHPNTYKKEKKGKKAKKAKKQKAVKPLRENRILEFSMAGLFVGVVASFILTDKVALVLSACFFAGIVLGMIFKKKTYVESLDELDIEEDFEEAPVAAEEIPAEAEEAAELEAEIITAE
ncbi:MAG: hypothetical protein IKJ70_00590 [Clostridia bacterium]|nr:hypothetical protein [Clostridia bacterium]